MISNITDKSIDGLVYFNFFTKENLYYSRHIIYESIKKKLFEIEKESAIA